MLSITNLYQQMMRSSAEIHGRLYSKNAYSIQIHQYETWMRRICYQYDSLLHSVRKMIESLFELYTEETLCTSLKYDYKAVILGIPWHMNSEHSKFCRLIEYFNELVSLDISINNDIRFTNPSSTIFENKKRYTLRKILKVPFTKTRWKFEYGSK